MTALVTGGAGFIGRHLARALAAAGQPPLLLDDLSTAHGDELDGLLAGGAHLVVGSVLDADLVESLVSEVDTVYHLAAAVGVRLVLDAPLAGLRTNIDGAANVLASAARHGTRVLLASTSEIYGRSTTAPLAEDADRVLGSPLLARWSYAEAKAVVESMAHAYWQGGLPVVIARLFNIVGPGQTGRYGMVLPRFADAALRGEPLLVHGDGTQTRCFCHVGDAVTGLVGLAGCAAAAGRAVNIGRPEEVSIMDLAHLVIERSGSISPVRLVPYEQVYPSGFEDVHRRVPDIALARELIGFDPRTRLAEVVDLVLADRAERLAGGPVAR